MLIKSREHVLGYLIKKELSKEPILLNETVRKNYDNRANYYLGLIIYFDNLNKYDNHLNHDLVVDNEFLNQLFSY